MHIYIYTCLRTRGFKRGEKYIQKGLTHTIPHRWRRAHAVPTFQGTVLREDGGKRLEGERPDDAAGNLGQGGVDGYIDGVEELRQEGVRDAVGCR